MPFQQTIIVGNLGRDAEIRYTQGGKAVLNFNVAVSEKWTDSSGEKQEETTWYRCTLWGERGETLKEYLVKGKQVLVIGKVKANGYQTNDGQVAASLDLNVRDVQLLGAKGETGAGRDNFVPPDEDVPF